MTDNISGYRELAAEEVAAINTIKTAESEVASLWRQLRDDLDTDPRWMNVAKTHFQEGFQAMVRAIARPVDPFQD